LLRFVVVRNRIARLSMPPHAAFSGGLPVWTISCRYHVFFERTHLMPMKHAASQHHHEAAGHHEAAAHHHREAVHHHEMGQHKEAKEHAVAAQEHSELAHKHTKQGHEQSHK
jgi:hypothetical protein